MILYPRKYLNKVTDITVDFLKENDIKALFLDVDNTLLDFDLKIVDDLESWYNTLKENNIKCVIVSNSNKETKIKLVSDLLNIPYVKFATKPFNRGFKKAQKMLDIPFENIAAVGDQIFTDVIGSNLCNMYSILVKPLAEKDLFLTRFKRPLENLVINKYLKSIER